MAEQSVTFRSLPTFSPSPSRFHDDVQLPSSKPSMTTGLPPRTTLANSSEFCNLMRGIDGTRVDAPSLSASTPFSSSGFATIGILLSPGMISTLFSKSHLSADSETVPSNSRVNMPLFQYVPMEKHVAPPPRITTRPSGSGTVELPTYNGIGGSELPSGPRH